MYICNYVFVCVCLPYVYTVNVVGECFFSPFFLFYLLLAAVAVFSFFSISVCTTNRKPFSLFIELSFEEMFFFLSFAYVLYI